MYMITMPNYIFTESFKTILAEKSVTHHLIPRFSVTAMS